jgi:hypothetical protein
MAQTLGEETVAQRPGPGIQRTAKRPDAKEGGREEEEKRLGIASATMDGRLRSAKTGIPDNTIGIVVQMLSGGRLKKFRADLTMGAPEQREIRPIGFIVTDQSQNSRIDLFIAHEGRRVLGPGGASGL